MAQESVIRRRIAKQAKVLTRNSASSRMFYGDDIFCLPIKSNGVLNKARLTRCLERHNLEAEVIYSVTFRLAL